MPGMGHIMFIDFLFSFDKSFIYAFKMGTASVLGYSGERVHKLLTSYHDT